MFSNRQAEVGLRSTLIAIGAVVIINLSKRLSKRLVHSLLISIFAVSAIVITVRASQDGGHHLCVDFAAAPSSCLAGFSIVILSWLATLAGTFFFT